MASLSHSFSLSGARGRLFREGQEEKEVAQIEEALGKEWFAITAFPLIAGTFGPIATALNICAMVESWLCRTAEPFGLGVPICVAPIRDPGWLMGLNAVSLFFGTVANLVIMLVNSSSWLAQHDLELVLANIICGYLSSLILVALVIALHFRRVLFVDREEEGPIAYAQAYFYGIMAAGLYFVTSTFVIYTASMIRRSHRKRDDLAKSFANGSRSLKILVIILMGYMLIGASIYHHIEGWSYLNAVFWVDVTILTVGFGGEFVPRTHLGKSLLFPFATIGVFIVMMVIYCTTQVVLDRGSSQWEVRIRDKKRREVRDQRDGHSHSRSSSRNKERSCTLTNPSTWFNRKIDTEFDDLSPNATREKSLQVGPRRSRREEDRLQRQRDFESMQKILKHSQHRRILLSICVWSLFALFLWLFGAVIFWFCEKDQHWSYFEAVYFTFISILTIGYGDNNLNSASGKSVFVLWSLLVVPTLTILISSSTQGIGLPSFQRMKSFWFWKSSKNGPKLSKSLSIYAASNVVPDSLPHNNHDKNHLLVRAIKSIARDHIRNQQTGKRADYSFDDWEYISYLMGSLDVPEERNRNGTNESEGSTSTRRRRRSGWQDWHEGGEPGVLDWLDLKNPLNVNEVLTEWMLLGLVERLEGELRELRRELGNVPLEEEEESTS